METTTEAYAENSKNFVDAAAAHGHLADAGQISFKIIMLYAWVSGHDRA